jgi:pyridoxamine 5'-phosphate oxidase
LHPDPIEQFRYWLTEALDAQALEPNAMTLATVDAAGRPSARVVLLKGVDDQGFRFFTNYESRKARDLAANPHAALVFVWLELERQVRVEGTVTRVSREESESYFKRRPHASQLGTWASRQSERIEGRDVLEERLAALQAQYPEGEVPLPPFWGGYVVQPQAIEFWQGRASRLHDRFLYRRVNAAWQIVRLAP